MIRQATLNDVVNALEDVTNEIAELRADVTDAWRFLHTKLEEFQ